MTRKRGRPPSGIWAEMPEHLLERQNRIKAGLESPSEPPTWAGKEYGNELRKAAISERFSNHTAWQSAVGEANERKKNEASACTQWIANNCNDLIDKWGAPALIKKRLVDHGFKPRGVSTIRRYIARIKSRSG